MRKCRAAVCMLLSLWMLIQPVLATNTAEESTEKNIPLTALADAVIASELKVKPEITEYQAAERLYYLGLMSGVGTLDGKVNFALSDPLTKLECLVMAIRLTGVESEVQQGEYSHPFTDVPDWGTSYVGYFWEKGMIAASEDNLLLPDTEVSTAVFMKYMLNTLGYSSDGTNYAVADAALIGQRIGICTEAVPSVTRGAAAMMMYRTLNTTMNGTDVTLSTVLVERGILDYRDVQFLLWNENAIEVETYVKEQGYTTVKDLNEGKYTVTVAGSTRCLNVYVDGANNDYEGVRVTTWDRTDDISQKFRLERTENGTYRMYSCASGGGYHRALGFSKKNTAGLYSTKSAYVGEFVLKYADAADGSWYLLSAADPALAMSTRDDRNGADLSLMPLGAEGYKQTFLFQFDGVVNAEGYEMAIYPAEDMNVTQGYYDNYSHQKQNAIDITTKKGSVYAPFTGKIVRIDRGYYRYNTVWLESCEKVVYADGSVDYMTVVFMHDNNIQNLATNQIVAQGEYFYDMGTAGGATGPHVHIAVIRGKYKSTMSLTGSGNVYPENALFVPADTTVYTSYGLDWVYID